jgi:hypothetical protein
MGRSHWTPEILFGHSRKPLHYTGGIGQTSLQRILNSSEWEDLDYVRTVVQVAAESIACNVLTLVVGSAADWSLGGVHSE